MFPFLKGLSISWGYLRLLKYRIKGFSETPIHILLRCTISSVLLESVKEVLLSTWLHLDSAERLCFLKVSFFQNVFLVPSFGQKYHRTFFQNFCPSLEKISNKKIKALYYTNLGLFNMIGIIKFLIKPLLEARAEICKKNSLVVSRDSFEI